MLPTISEAGDKGAGITSPVGWLPGIKARRLFVADLKGGLTRFLKTAWQDLTFFAFAIAHIAFIVAVICLPDGPGEWLINWLAQSAQDARVLWFKPELFYHWPVTDRHGLPQVVCKSNFDLPLFLKTVLTSVVTLLIMPRIISSSAFLTSFARRLRTQFNPHGWVEDFLEVLRQPVRKLTIKESIPWLHHASTTFFWLIFCYAILFALVSMSPGPLGTAIVQWLDCSFTEAGFRPHAVERYPQLRVFMASLVAMIGVVPLAVTGCVFLPAMKSKFVAVGADGIVLPQGPFTSLGFRPMRAWGDMRSVTLRGRPGESRFNKRTLVISFFSGGSLRLKLHQLAEKDLYDLLSAVDEHADDCFIAEDVLELRRALSERNGAKALPAEGELRSLPADNFRSTVFVPYEVGEKPNPSMRIVRQLATKQLSAVYLVRLEDGRLAIAKQFSFPNDSPPAERMRKNFLREYRLLSQLSHDRIAKVIDLFELGSSSILLLEYARGRDLRDIVERDGARPEQFVIEIARQVCDLMVYLHRQSPAVLHRDLTPDNLIIDEDRNVRLIDFGAAHQFLEGITGTLIGKQCYVAPEQLRGEPTTKSDVYAFGCTLHFLLTGEDPLALSRCDTEQHVAVSAALRDLIKQCTEFDAEKRPRSFEDIKRIIEGIKAGNLAPQDPGFKLALPVEEDSLVAMALRSGERK